MTERSLAQMTDMVGAHLGTSVWYEITQEAINTFADCTGDHQWIHVDVERARAESPFGGTVAHGYLTLSMVSVMLMEIGIAPTGTAAALNYGLDKVRFLAPVPVGSRLRLHCKLQAFDARPGGYLMKIENTMEIEGADKPALVAEGLVFLIPEPAAADQRSE